jgi:hypothetical protein
MKKIIDFNSADPEVIKNSKNIVTIGGIVLLVFFLSLTLLSSTNKKNHIKFTAQDNKSKNKIDIASSINLKAEDEWVNKSENDLRIMREENKVLLKRLELMEEEQKRNQENYANVINQLAIEVSNLKNTQYGDNNTGDHNHNHNQQYNDYGELIIGGNNIEIVTIDLENNIGLEDDNYNDLENYIPAGSYATAKMLSGADVSTGVNSQNDPNNMMFEIISPVFVPSYKGKKQEIGKIEGCRVMGAAIGQLWTEKAYIRLLKMSCSFEKGKVAEYNVKGYVTSFAKEGVRGKIVSREGYFTSMAFLAGAVEGLADITKTAYSPTLEVSSGMATESIKSSDIAKQAGASGIAKSAEMLSDYYIKRAEQYQSVVDVPTGIEVEIVFQEGVDLSKNISFKVKPNDIGRAVGIQTGQDLNANDSRSRAYVNNNGGF